MYLCARNIVIASFLQCLLCYALGSASRRVRCDTKCLPGWGLTTPCNSTQRSAICGPCPDNHWTPRHPHTSRCRPCSACGDGLYEERACGRTHDTKCDSCDTVSGRITDDYWKKCPVISVLETNDGDKTGPLGPTLNIGTLRVEGDGLPAARHSKKPKYSRKLGKLDSNSILGGDLRQRYVTTEEIDTSSSKSGSTKKLLTISNSKGSKRHGSMKPAWRRPHNDQSGSEGKAPLSPLKAGFSLRNFVHVGVGRETEGDSQRLGAEFQSKLSQHEKSVNGNKHNKNGNNDNDDDDDDNEFLLEFLGSGEDYAHLNSYEDDGGDDIWSIVKKAKTTTKRPITDDKHKFREFDGTKIVTHIPLPQRPSHDNTYEIAILKSENAKAKKAMLIRILGALLIAAVFIFVIILIGLVWIIYKAWIKESPHTSSAIPVYLDNDCGGSVDKPDYSGNTTRQGGRGRYRALQVQLTDSHRSSECLYFRRAGILFLEIAILKSENAKAKKAMLIRILGALLIAAVFIFVIILIGLVWIIYKAWIKESPHTSSAIPVYLDNDCGGSVDKPDYSGNTTRQGGRGRYRALQVQLTDSHRSSGLLISAVFIFVIILIGLVWIIYKAWIKESPHTSSAIPVYLDNDCGGSVDKPNYSSNAPRQGGRGRHRALQVQLTDSHRSIITDCASRLDAALEKSNRRRQLDDSEEAEPLDPQVPSAPLDSDTAPLMGHENPLSAEGPSSRNHPPTKLRHCLSRESSEESLP